MGFNIGILSNYPEADNVCYNFIDRTFYNFVVSGDMFGDESILIKSGQHFGLDLSPLLKLTYINGDVSELEIKENLQNTDFLLSLVTTFRDNLLIEQSLTEKIEYTWLQLSMTDEQLEQLIAEEGIEIAKEYIDIVQEQKKELTNNPNPWKWYFDDRKILEDLNNVITTLKCYSDKGIGDGFLTAG